MGDMQTSEVGRFFDQGSSSVGTARRVGLSKRREALLADSLESHRSVRELSASASSW